MSDTIRNVATAKQTGGGGFTFEDKVTAWFISHLLGNTIAIDKEIGKIARIDFQVRPQGWLFDDLLITQQSAEGDESRMAVSIKSNVQFSGSGPTSELLYDLWNQYTGEPARIFDPLEDYLCIVNAPAPASIGIDLIGLLKAAKVMDPAIFLENISQPDKGFSASKMTLFKNFQCPEDLAAKHGISDSDTVTLLSRLYFLDFDFESPSSRSESSLIAVLRPLLRNTDGNAEMLLYDSLCRLRSEYAPGQSYLDLDSLVKKIRTLHNLADHPTYVSEWKKISTVSKMAVASLHHTIGNYIDLPRKDELDKLKGEVENNEAVFVLGKSGYGKSVLVKKLLEQEADIYENFIWIDAFSIGAGNLTHYFGLHHPLSEVVKNIRRQSYLVIDGIDRILKEEELRVLYEIISIAKSPDSGWKIIITCQNEDYWDVISRLSRINISLSAANFAVRLNMYNHVGELRTHFPELADLYKHKHLKTVLNNLKYVDMLAIKLTSGAPIPEKDLIGEATIIDWIWSAEFDSIGTRFMHTFGEKQAQQFALGVPVTDFSIPDMQPLDSLKAKKILYEETDKLYLVHDLFGDWARYKLLRSKDQDIKSYLLSIQLVSPLWRKAIRLYGIYLLDNESGAAAWISLMKRLSESEPAEKIVQDLLLESLFFSASPYRHLESVLEYLKEDDGKMFRRFIDQFMIKATVPNHNVMEFAKDMDGITGAEAASYARVPDFMYWPDIISFIRDHKDSILEYARLKIANLCSLWFTYTKPGFPYRDEAAEIALANAKWMFDFKLNRGFVSGDADEEIYSAFLAAVHERPDEVAELALKLCKRIKVERPKSDTDKGFELRPKSLFAGAKIRDAKQWPDGPYENVDDAFEEVCLDKGSLEPMIQKLPEKAMEVCLALLIEPPREVSFGYDSSHYHLDINRPRRWFPPFYTRGPFMYFFKHHPWTGIELVIKLVNFAATQWTNSYTHEGKDIPKLVMPVGGTDKDFIGDERMYYWFRNSTSGPHAVVSALQSLEKFLIDTVDNGQPIDEYIAYILNNATTCAFLGVLSSMGKYNPVLFTGPLQPMFGVLPFYFWEKGLDFGGHGIEEHQMMGSNFLGKETWELANEWHKMPHRKRSIGSAAITLYMHNDEIKDLFTGILDDWNTILTKIGDDARTGDYIKRLISFFNRDNYETRDHNGQAVLAYVEPSELASEFQEVRQQFESSNSLLTFPFQCMQIIDKGEMVSPEQCAAIWQTITEQIGSDDDAPYEYLGGKHRIVLGGSAVLFYNSENWLDTNPEAKTTILSYLGDVLEIYVQNDYGLLQGDMGDSWHSFAARILGLEWHNDRASEPIRKMISSLILKCPYATIKNLLMVLAKQSGWADKDFVQLQNLILLYAAARYKAYALSTRTYFGEHSQPEDFVLNEHLQKIADDFINATIPSSLIDWSELRFLAKKGRKKWGDNDDEGNRFLPGIDIKILQHLFAALPKLEGLSGADRAHILALWQQALNQIVFELGPVTEVEPDREYPDEFHFFVIQKIGELLLDIQPDDNLAPPDFWKPLLAYGNQAQEWVKHLIESYFIGNIEQETKREKFFEEWTAMTEFVLVQPTWNSDKYRRPSTIAFTLFSISDRMIPWWKNLSYAHFYDKAIQKVIAWAATKKYDQEVICRVLTLLTVTAGKLVLHEGIDVVITYLRLRIATDKVGPPKGYVRREFECEDTLAKTASFLWEKHKEDIKGNPTTLNALKETILYLVARQNSIGLELQERVLF
ncbi:hypothetical protein KJK34_03380 [Flavobacterium sp. D11R37]|uniref:hypothetical protein n=1 Tax=Flavobacterium coralii TaxID=2838017 RepID=UPI001CA70557|nr:hypothetical protein [Flavobacterium coralii]MBY8961789.1 hypothetical protein [Flavobacterium coralii]